MASHILGEPSTLIEFLDMGPMGSLDMAVELGGTGWQHEEPNATPLTLPLRLGLELTAPSTWMARKRSCPLTAVGMNQELALAIARLKARQRHRMAYADCLAAPLAQYMTATLVTGHTYFRQEVDRPMKSGVM
jgi:hypothetical protein